MNRNLGDQVGDFVLWENDRVRIWDQVINPGETVGPHVHPYDYFTIILEDAAVVTDVLEGKARAETPVYVPDLEQHGRLGAVHWIETNGEEHTATNVDRRKRRWRNLIVELKK